MLLWSADLSDDRDDHERRLLAAAAELIWAQSFGRAEALRPRVAECAPSALRDLILLALGPDDHGTPGGLAVLADALAAGPPRGAALVGLAMARGRVGRGDGRFEAAIARQVLAVGGLKPDIRTTAECLAAGTADRPPSETAPRPAARPGEALQLWRRATGHARAGHLAAAVHDLSAALRLPDEPDVAANMMLAYLQYLLGSWEAAAAAAEQAIALALHRGATWSYASAHAIAACVAASSGALPAAEEHLRTSRRWWRTVGRPADALYPAIAAATLAQAKGDHPAMQAALEPLSPLPGAPHGEYHEWCWWWPLQVEALIGVGRLDDAARALAPFTAAVGGTPCLRAASAWLTGWLAHRRGDLDAARTSYAAELTGAPPPGGDDIPLLRARLEHAHGQLLLTQRNRRAAVSWLRAARERYRSLGAAPYLARCDADLAACGLRTVPAGSGPRTPASVLSKQEDRVARLVAQGMTNGEVARELYVSTKTVEFHLSNIFTKLGITSRRQLRHGQHAADLLPA
jgi:DNA-binding CsgD family transcriptional regulator/tetratricopeptide (TPR) repeat protein